MFTMGPGEGEPSTPPKIVSDEAAEPRVISLGDLEGTLPGVVSQELIEKEGVLGAYKQFVGEKLDLTPDQLHQTGPEEIARQLGAKGIQLT